MSTEHKPMTEARLAEIEARAAAATPGPWPLGLTMFRKRGEARAAQYQADEKFVLAARQDVPDLVAEVRRLREALEDMVYQFSFWSEAHGGCLWTGGMSALEDAFDALGWPDDLHPAPDLACDVDGCSQRVSCGWPSPDGYRRTCGKHYDGRHTVPISGDPGPPA